jgi:hypothetical protein
LAAFSGLEAVSQSTISSSLKILKQWESTGIP